MKDPADWAKIKKTIEISDIGTLIVIGGNGTLSAAYEVSEKGVPVVGIPKTIDNDIIGTEASIGFDTAISVVVEAMERLRTTAESHHRIMIIEVMGRATGWIALMSGIAGRGDMILLPEIHFSIDDILRNLKARYEAGKKFSVVVIAEGTRHEDITTTKIPECSRDECGHEKFVGVGNLLGKELEHQIGIETRVTILGHTQRGGTPTAYDRVLATRFGISAVEQIITGNVGCMVALQGTRIEPILLRDVASRIKPVDPGIYNHLGLLHNKR